MDYELVIPAAEKDFNKIPYLLQSAKEYLNPQPVKVNIIYEAGKLTANDYILLNTGYPVTVRDERGVLPDFDPKKAKGFRRPQWIYQQFLKLFQNITETNHYLVMDSDLILNKEIHLFDENENPYFFLGVDQNHRPYFNYMDFMFGFGREYPYSFISEIMMFRKDVTQALATWFELYQRSKQRLPYTVFANTHSHRVKLLYEWTCDRACDDFIPADYEIYGNFIERLDKRMYSKRHIKTNLKGKYSNWTNAELEQYIKEMKELNEHDMFTAHTWL